MDEYLDLSQMDPTAAVHLLRLQQETQERLANPPPTVNPGLQAPPPEGMVRCACNQKFMPHEDVQMHNSDFIKGITDSICRECALQCRNFALVACIRCKSVVARMPPQRYDTGFVLRANGVYHTNGCPNCLPKVERELLTGETTHVTFLIEKAVFDLANGHPVKEEIKAGLKWRK